MNELNPGVINYASLAVSLIVLVIGLVAWFFVNRASVRAGEQVALLEALLDQQKRQNAMLRRLLEPKDAQDVEKTATTDKRPLQEDKGDDLLGLVAER